MPGLSALDTTADESLATLAAVRRRSIAVIAGIAALLGAAGCSSSLAEPAPSVEPAGPATTANAQPDDATLPPAGPAGLIVSIPGDLDALIAIHASARDQLRACIDDHNSSSSGVDARRFPC